MNRLACIALSLCAATAVHATPSDSNARQDLRAEARAHEYALKEHSGGKRALSVAKATVNYPGDLTGAPEYTRPFADCTGATGLGPMGYSLQPFSVDTDGAYTITSEQTGFDGFIFLYEDAFDPLAPLTNCIIGNDDSSGIGFSEIAGAALTAGTTYIVVTTAFENGEAGPFSNTIDGPGAITLEGLVAADLSIVKTAPGGVNANSPFTYVLSAANAGPEPATEVIVTDVLPAEVTFVDSSCPTTLVGNTVTWSIGDMALGDVAECTITVDPVAESCVGITNTATIDGAESDFTTSNNSSTVSNGGGNVVGDPSFETSLVDNTWTQTSATFGTPICDVANCGVGGGTGPRTGDFWTWFGGFADGAETASMEQSVTIQSGVTEMAFWFESANCDAGNGAADFVRLTIDGDEVWRADALGAACGTVGYSEVVVDISAYADDAAHTVRFESETLGNVDGATVSNFFIEDVEILSAPVCNVAATDVSVTLDATPEPALAGGPLTYSSTVANAGPLDALDVEYSLSLSTGVTFTSIDADPAFTCTTPAVGETGTIECSVALLGAAESLAIEVVTGIDSTVVDDFSAIATVVTSSSDSNPTNDEAVAETTLLDAADLAVSIDDGVSGVLDGDTVVYQLIATNNGPNTATDAGLSTTLSDNLVDVEWTCTGVGAVCPAASGSGDILALVTLDPGASLEYEITATVDLSVVQDPTTASAEITSPAGLPDPDTGNNTDTDTDILLTIGIFSDGFED
ncbi:DUF11 domain-containing protein [Chiayiivirga flava]|uniref:Putative repeat protein (TIGR01451 family) n=1 Tax=Chiayiivirga flava TaxID=659595 RepID=A0A7W8D7M4_9GAMM|nr:DUF11 domain-containing protein [Chiayiivirga flava]MBB5209380.1 putative repeat protein (TIGR01451 family) [Chiayiivirga flava]